METLAMLVKRLREERGWTQEDLAEMVGRRQRWVSDVENGTVPRPHLIRALASAFGVDPVDLVIAADITRDRDKVHRLARSRCAADQERLDLLHEKFDRLLLAAGPVELQIAELTLSRGARAGSPSTSGSPDATQQTPTVDGSEW